MAAEFSTSYDNGNYIVTDLTPNPEDSNYYGKKTVQIVDDQGNYLANQNFDRTQAVMSFPTNNWTLLSNAQIQVNMFYYYNDTTIDGKFHQYVAPKALNTKIQ